MKPGGTCIATFFLLTPQRRQTSLAGEGALAFRTRHQNSWVENPDLPEIAVAHEEARLLAVFGAVGLSLRFPIRYGSWDRSQDQDQDFVTFRREA